MASNSQSCWEWLPQDLLYLILDRIVPLSDCVHFSVVCKLWRSVAVDYFHQQKPSNSRSNRQQLPLLMIPTKDNSEERRGLYSVTDQKVYKTQLPVPYNRRCCGSSHGWLVTVDENMIISLRNPFSGAVISLPPIRSFYETGSTEEDNYAEDDEYYFYDIDTDEEDNDDDDGAIEEDLVLQNNYEYSICKVVLSKDPHEYPDDYVVMAIYGNMKRLGFIKSGDKDWTYLDNNLQVFADIIYHVGKFHMLKFAWDEGQVFSCDVSKFPPEISPGPAAPFLGVSRLYLVELPERGDLVIVQRMLDDETMTNGFKMMKLQFDENDESKWVETSTLGDAALFLGDNHSISVKASDFPGCQTDCIYFTDDFDDIYHGYTPYADHGGGGPFDIGFFNLKEGSFGKHYRVDPSHEFMPPPIWILPKFIM